MGVHQKSISFVSTGEKREAITSGREALVWEVESVQEVRSGSEVVEEKNGIEGNGSVLMRNSDNNKNIQ